jgi:NAD+ synthase
MINNSITAFIKNYVQLGNVNGVVLGLSGGIDSSVAAYCAFNSLGKEKVFGLLLPDKDITPQQDIDDALEICSVLNIDYRIIYINDIKNQFLETLEETDDKLVKGNLLSRTRMCILYYYANLMNRLVLGTADKSELSIGYFTKFGDGASDLLPIGDLYKTQLKEYAKFLNVPQQIIAKKSSARLWKNQETEIELGISFEELDSILFFIHDNDKNTFDSSLLKKRFPSISNETIRYVLDLIKKNEHKFSLPPICNIN